MGESDKETYYPHLREVLDPRFGELSDAELEEAFESAFGEGITPAEYEEFFGGLGKALSGAAREVGRFAQKAAPIVATGAQGALSGAAGGAALGPFGMIGGALAGGVGSALSRHSRGPARGIGNILGGVSQAAGMLTGAGGLARGASGLLGMAGQLAGRGSPAAGQLLGLLRRPELSQALRSMFGGRNAAVPVGPGRTPVPPADFARLLSGLAREAETEAWSDDSADTVPAYLMDMNGGLVVDPSDPDQRAARLLQLLSYEAEHEDSELEASETDESEPEAGFDDAWELVENEDYIFELFELDESDDTYLYDTAGA